SRLFAQHIGLAVSAVDDAKKNLDRRGLSGAVGAEKAEDFSRLNLEVRLSTTLIAFPPRVLYVFVKLRVSIARLKRLRLLRNNGQASIPTGSRVTLELGPLPQLSTHSWH